MKLKKIEGVSLRVQLVIITILAALLALISFGVILPNVLKPFYESNIYDYLKQPAELLRLGDAKAMSDVAYIMKTQSGAIFVSNNFSKIFGKDVKATDILLLVTKEYSKFKYNNSTYYYYVSSQNNTQNIVITDDTMIVSQEDELLSIMLPTMLATIAITSTLTFCWSNYVVNKIKYIKKKTELLATNKYIAGEEYIIDDELSNLNMAIDTAQKELKSKEEYKNFMFQNLSHELKTPLAVIQSYVEAIEDGVVTDKEAFGVIKDESVKLNAQVQTLLQFNKIDYISQTLEVEKSKVDIVPIICESIETHKHIRSDIQYNFEVNTKNVEYMGTQDMWMTVFDNILGNFVRYAKSAIIINVNDNSIIMSNDGEQFEEEVLKNMFVPYVKGKCGQTGLGLSIVKRIIDIFGCQIVARNTNNGVEMEIQIKR